MKFENYEAWGFKHAIRGARNPMNSWDKMDSDYLITNYEKHDGEETIEYDESQYFLGIKDIDLMQRLIKAGPEHRKFMRQIFVSVDITAPLYWWKEFDTYKIGTVSNSCSTMHKIHSKPITLGDFEIDDYIPIESITNNLFVEENLIPYLEKLRQKYIETKQTWYWKELIRWLPESYLQKRTITMNYENLYSIVRQRRGHKLSEWKTFIYWAHELPYANELIFYEY